MARTLVVPEDDQSYEQWLRDHPNGFVLASDKVSYNRMHRATCRTITGSPTNGNRWIRPGAVKVCAPDLGQLREWALAHPETIQGKVVACRICVPT